MFQAKKTCYNMLLKKEAEIMKIFNDENGVKKVYIQMNDIMMLTYSDISMPSTIFEKVFSDVVIVNDNNRMDFVEFTQPQEVEYFKSLDWIVDYKQIRNLSEEEIKEKGQEIASEMNEIANKYNSMTDDEKRDNQSIIQRHELLDYKMKSLAEILWIKQGHKQMPFPVVPDSDGFAFIGDDNCKYEIRASLEPNKMLLFRKDGKKLSNEDRIPRGFLQTGMSIAIMEKNKNNEFEGEYKMSNSLTDDNQYFVTEFKIKNYDNKHENQEELKEEKGIKKLIKRFLNKNKLFQ